MIIIPIKWLFHWEYTQHFQTNPYLELILIESDSAMEISKGGPKGGDHMWRFPKIRGKPQNNWFQYVSILKLSNFG